LHSVPRAYGQPAAIIRLDPEELGRRYLSRSAAELGISPASKPVYATQLRAVLRDLGLIDQRCRPCEPLSPDWAELCSRVPGRFPLMRLAAMLRWCDVVGITPSAVPWDLPERYLQHLRKDRMVRNAPARARRAMHAWNKARNRVPGWPDVMLTSPNLSKAYAPPLAIYPQTLRDEIASWERTRLGQEPQSLFGGGLKRPPLRPATVQKMIGCMRRHMAALIETGSSPETFTTLATLVTEDAIKQGLEWHWTRAGCKATQNLSDLGSMMVEIARHIGIAGPKLKTVLDLVKEARPPKQSRMTEKNERRLRRLDDPVILAKTLHVGEHLMRLARARKANGDTLGAAWQASTAVAISFLLRCPLRIETLCGLKLGTELITLDGRSTKITHLDVPGERTKTGEPVRWRLHARTVAVVDEFLRDFRHDLPGAGGIFLFPARDTANQPRSAGGLSLAIRAAFAGHVGIEFNAHLFRALACKLTLDADPGAFHDLRLLLGHRTLSTALTYYATFAPQQAADRLDARVTRLQRQSEKLARAAFDRVRPAKPKDDKVKKKDDKLKKDEAARRDATNPVADDDPERPTEP